MDLKKVWHESSDWTQNAIRLDVVYMKMKSRVPLKARNSLKIWAIYSFSSVILFHELGS